MIDFFASYMINRERPVPIRNSTPQQIRRSHLHAGGTLIAKGLLARLDKNGKVTRPPGKKTVKKRLAGG